MMPVRCQRGRACVLTFAHSLERPDMLTDKEGPVYLRLDFVI